MPPKKNAANPAKPAPEPVSVVHESGDPVVSAISIIDKKVRNLEKRRNKLTTLKESAQELGEVLDKDQQAAITKIKDVNLQLELMKDLQKQFALLQTEFQKIRKRQQRQERQQAKEAEHESELKVVSYTLRVQDMLNLFGDEDKENFRTGNEGAVKLEEEELAGIDELYKLVNPRREDNPNYDTEVASASEYMLLLFEGSSKEISGTTYKSLREVLERVDQCGYFNQPSHGTRDEQDSEEEEEEDADDYKSADEQVSVRTEEAAPAATFTEEVDVPPEVPPMAEPEPPTQYLGSPDVISEAPPVSAVISQTINYMPSAPSPTFPALGNSPILMVHDDGFSFMHESEVDRKQHLSPTSPNAPFTTSQQITHQAPPSQVQSHPVPPVVPKVDYHQYSNRGGMATSPGEQEVVPAGGSILNPALVNQAAVNSRGQGATDVTTGQPNPAIQATYQSTNTMDPTSALLSSAPQANREVGVMDVGNPAVLYPTVTPEVPSGYRQQPVQNHQPYYRASHNKGGRGNNQQGGGAGRRPPGGQQQGGGGNKGNYGNNRSNGRGTQGYESQGHGQSTYSSRGYGGNGGGGGFQQQQTRGGRPNYRTSGGQKKS